MAQPLFAITISHQFGSGGTLLGQQLAKRLGVPFFDREILRKVADSLHMLETDLVAREERLSTFWESFGRNSMLTNPAWIIEGVTYPPSDLEVFDQECETIEKIAEKSSGVFLGRCGFHILRDHPSIVKILVFANQPERVERVKQLYKMDDDAALRLIQSNDRERAAYVRAFTHQEWLNASLYDICMNTSSLGKEKAVEIALTCILQKISSAEVKVS